MRTLRASELGSFLYCRRAWWYQLQGIRSQNQAELQGGTAFHHEHGRKVLQAQMLRLGAWAALLLALVLAAVGLTLLVLP